MIRIAFDLELEQPNTRSECQDSKLTEEKIIQVGWVVFEDTPFTLLKEQCHEVNIGVPICKYIQKLTGITNEQIENGKELIEIYKLMKSDREEFEASRILIQWGGGDFNCLMRELPGVESAFGHSGKNVKHLFQDWAYVNGLSASGGLSKSMNKMGLNWQRGKKHNALADAKNTAYIYSELLKRIKSERTN